MSRLVCVTTGVNTPTWVLGLPLPPRMPDWLNSPILDRLALKPPEMQDMAFASRVWETARSLMINMMMLLYWVGWLGELFVWARHPYCIDRASPRSGFKSGKKPQIVDEAERNR